MENNHLDIATDLMENILTKHFVWYLTCKEVAEDGSISVLYTEKSDEILKDLLKFLENNYGKNLEG